MLYVLSYRLSGREILATIETRKNILKTHRHLLLFVTEQKEDQRVLGSDLLKTREGEPIKSAPLVLGLFNQLADLGWSIKGKRSFVKKQKVFWKKNMIL